VEKLFISFKMGESSNSPAQQEFVLPLTKCGPIIVWLVNSLMGYGPFRFLYTSFLSNPEI